MTEADSPIDLAPRGRPRRLPGLRPHHDRHLPLVGHAGALCLRLPVHRPRAPATAPTPTPPTPGSRCSCPACAGSASTRPTTPWPASATSPSPSAATTPTCRRRAGVYKGEAESQLAVGGVGAPGPRGPGRAGVHAPVAPSLVSRRPAPARLRTCCTTSSSNSSSSQSATADSSATRPRIRRANTCALRAVELSTARAVAERPRTALSRAACHLDAAAAGRAASMMRQRALGVSRRG